MLADIVVSIPAVGLAVEAVVCWRQRECRCVLPCIRSFSQLAAVYPPKTHVVLRAHVCPFPIRKVWHTFKVRTRVVRTRVCIRVRTITLSQKRLEIQALRCNTDTRGRCQHRREHGIQTRQRGLDSEGNTWILDVGVARASGPRRPAGSALSAPR
jgi:hypothetical protein